MLPITAEDESPFPTLDEVEQMSNQQIELVHANRELPKIDNPTWKIGGDEAGPSKAPTEATPVPFTDDTADTTDIAPTTDGFHNNNAPAKKPPQTYIGHKIPEEFLKKAGLLGNTDEDDASHIEPLYKLNEDGSIPGKYRQYMFKLPLRLDFPICLFVNSQQRRQPKSMKHWLCLVISNFVADKNGLSCEYCRVNRRWSH